MAAGEQLGRQAEGSILDRAREPVKNGYFQSRKGISGLAPPVTGVRSGSVLRQAAAGRKPGLDRAKQPNMASPQRYVAAGGQLWSATLDPSARPRDATV